MSNTLDYIDKARAILTDAGILFEPLDCSGEMAYRGTTKKPNSTTGRYILHLDNNPRVWFCNRHNGDDDKGQVVNLYSNEEWQTMTEADKEALRERIRQEKQAAQEANEKKRQQAAREAKSLWAKCSYATDKNAYLSRKGVIPLGDMMQDAEGRLVLPMKNSEGETVSLQFIAGDGEKRFLPGGEKKGCYFPIPAHDGDKYGTLLIGEGVATVLSCCMSTGFAGLVAFDAGNLLPVAEAARARYPQREILVCADNDIREDGKPNTGAQKATEAAQAIGGKLAICPAINGRKADFNDLATATDDGLERVRVCIEKALSEPEKPYLPAGYHVIKEGSKAGLYKLEKSGDDEREVRLGPPLKILGRTRDEHSEAWGVLLEWKDPAGVQHRMALPDEALQTTGRDWAANLARCGYAIEPGMHSRFISMLAGVRTGHFVTNTAKVGWFGDVFVLPDAAIGAEDGSVVLQSLDSMAGLYQTAGTLEEWQEMAALCAGNTRFAFALCAAFAGPLLRLAGLEGGGFSFEGASSSGKTTCLQVAASVWGSPAHVRTWRATSNGLESIASLHNDSLLVLDEVGQTSGKDLSEVAYMLANGAGKTRAGRSGGARSSITWRLLFLSSGELGLADKLKEDGIQARAGQEVRFVGIPVDAQDVANLHDFNHAGALVNRIKELSGKNYGHASRAFLRWLVRNLDEVKATLPEILPVHVGRLTPADAGEQVRRVAQRFAIVAAAGVFAQAAGILPAGKEMNIFEAVRACFDAWLDQRGGVGATENENIINAVALFLEKHGQSRFQDVDDKNSTCFNRAGFRRMMDGQVQYLVLPQSFKEIVVGYPPARAARVLYEAGLLEKGKEADRYTNKVKTPEGKRQTCYILTRPEE